MKRTMDQLELQRPHGFLLWRGKKAAIARPLGQELEAGTPLQITCDGEAFGTVVLGDAATVPVLEFDETTRFKEHRVFPRERKAWWPGETEFLVYPVAEFEPLSKPQWVKAAAPNYGSTRAPERCPTCLEYSDGFCRLHDQVVEDDYVCDDWDDFEDWRGGEPGEPETGEKAAQALPVSEVQELEDWRGMDPEEESQPGPFSSIKVTGWGDPRQGAKAYTGAMVALFLPTEDAQALAMDLGEGSLPADELHITLLYLGDSQELENREAAEQAVADLAESLQPLEGKIGGYGVFTGGDDGDAVYLSFDAKEMPGFREAVAQRLAEAGFEQPGEHGFTPHITLAYLSEGQEVPALEIENRTIRLDEITLAWGDERSTFPLGAKKQKEAEAMPYYKEKRGDDWCVFKEGDEDPMKCYDGDDAEDRADAYLTALKINVEAAEKQAGLTAEKAVELAVRAQKIADALGQGEDVEAILREYLQVKAGSSTKAEVTKSEKDGQHPKSHYLVVEDPEHPSTWHLRVKNADGELDHRLMGAAYAALTVGYRGNKYQGPDKEKAIAKLKKLYESEGMELPGGEKAQDEGAIGGQATKDGGRITKESGQEPEAELVPAQEAGTETDMDTKAGRRLKRSMKDRIRDAVETLKEVLGWAEYEDEASPGGLDSFFKMMDSDHGMGIKAVDGEPLLVTWTTNAFKDRQKEIFATTCLEQYVTEAEAKGDRGTYDFWHIKSTDFADVIWQGVIGRFLVEIGRFHDTTIGRKAQAFFTKYPNGHPKHAPEGWGSSPEFRYLPEERKSGTYNWIWIVRRAVLPRAAAANVWTQGRTEVSAMALTKQQKDAAKEILGEELLDQIISGAESRSKELEQTVAHKAAETEEAPSEEGETEEELEEEGRKEQASPGGEEDEEEAPSEDDAEPEADEGPSEEGKAETTQVEVDVKAIAEQLANIFEVKLDPMTELAEQVQELAQDVKALRKEVQAVKGEEAIKQQVETPRFVLNLTKKASEAEETVVEDDNPLLKMKPVERKVNESGAANFFGKA